MRCPSIDQLRDLLADQLSPAEERTIDSHVESCPVCQQTLEDLTLPSTVFVDESEAADGSESSSLADQFLHARAKSDTNVRQRSEETNRDDPGNTPQASRLPTIPGYEILGELGSGGMGRVFKARDQRLDRIVALKCIRTIDTATLDQIVRFRGEVSTIARFKHPNIVQVHDIGSEDEVPFCVLEYVDGGTLADFLKQDQNILRPESAAELVETLAFAIEHAHQRSVVHRDLKPSNILLQKPERESGVGVPKITDFGLAKLLGSDLLLTQTGELAGTPSYMAPEQVTHGSSQIGPQADIYALGGILYELLSGRPPFRAETILETVQQVVDHEPVSPRQLQPKVPKDLETICLKCLEKKARRRYATAKDLAQDLQRFRLGEPIRARPVGRMERAWKWAQRRPTIAGLLLFLVLSLVGGTTVSVFFAIAAQRAKLESQRTAIAAQTQSADLLLQRGLETAKNGRASEALHWMLESLRVSPDPAQQRLVRIHLNSWARRVPQLMSWLDTKHRFGALSPDGFLFVSGGRTDANNKQATVQFWDARTGDRIGEQVQTGELGISSFEFSPDGRRLISVSGFEQEIQNAPGWVSDWNVQTRTPVHRFKQHEHCVVHARWSPDGANFLSTSMDGTACLWNWTTRKLVWQTSVLGRWVTASDFHPDGEYVVVVFALDGGKSRVTVISTVDGHPVVDPIPIPNNPFDNPKLDVAWSPAGDLVVVVDELGSTTFRWDSANRRLVRLSRSEPLVVSDKSFTPDGRTIGLFSKEHCRDGTTFFQTRDGIQIWRAPRDQSATPDQTSHTKLGHVDDAQEKPVVAPVVVRAKFAGNGRRVFCVSYSQREIQCFDQESGMPTGIPVPHENRWFVARTAISNDGKLVATVTPVSEDQHLAPVQIWDAETGNPCGPELPQRNSAQALAFSPDKRLLAVGGHDHQVQLWIVATGERESTAWDQGDMVMDLAFSPDGSKIAVATWAGEVRLWDVARRELLIPPLRHGEAVISVGFYPDGSRVLATCQSATYVWDVANGEMLGMLPFPEPASGSRGLQDLQHIVSPDGRTILHSAGFSSFQLWDGDTFEPVGRHTPLGKVQLSSFAFSADGRLVIAGHEDGSTQLWDVASMKPLCAPVVQPSPVCGVQFSVEAETFLTITTDGCFRTWRTPTPMTGSVEDASHAIQLMTGMELDGGDAVVPLSRDRYVELKKRFESSISRILQPISDDAWHRAKAIEALQAQHGFAARWHLDRLIQNTSGDWKLLARRAHSYVEDEIWQEAESDYEHALELTSRMQLTNWYWHCVTKCCERRNWPASLWYLERIATHVPDDWRVFAKRATIHAQIGNTEQSASDRETAKRLGGTLRSIEWAQHTDDSN